MTEQRRTWRVLMCLAAAMTAGAVVLMALEGGPVSAGAFSLASYTSLNSVENIIGTVKPRPDRNWTAVEVRYISNSSGQTDRLAELIGVDVRPKADFHFVVSDGRYGSDGFIISTDNWKKQSLYDRELVNSSVSSIRIGVITQNDADGCTDCQRQRTTALVDRLSRRFNIAADNIRYPADWRL